MNYEDYEDGIFFDDIDVNENLEFDEISKSIHDGADLEKLIFSIKKIEKEIDFLNFLKKKRVNPIDEKISQLKDKENKLRDITLELMHQYFPDQNVVDFPGLGKIHSRKNVGKWVVVDDDLFSELLKTHKLYDEVVETKYSFNKKKIPRVVSMMLTKIKEEELSGIKFEKPEKNASVIIKFYDKPDNKSEKSDIGF